MAQLHSASKDMILYLQDYAKAYGERKKEQPHCTQTSIETLDALNQEIHRLEEKLTQYEQHKAETLCQVIDALSPPSERIKLMPIYKRLNFLS